MVSSPFFDGTASSPVVHGGRVYQLHDNDGDSFLAALDAKTGKEVWKVKRADMAGRIGSGWATPLVWNSGARTEIVTIGRGFAISYDTNGQELWRLKGMTQATPSPVAAAIGIAAFGAYLFVRARYPERT